MYPPRRRSRSTTGRLTPRPMAVAWLELGLELEEVVGGLPGLLEDGMGVGTLVPVVIVSVSVEWTVVVLVDLDVGTGDCHTVVVDVGVHMGTVVVDMFVVGHVDVSESESVLESVSVSYHGRSIVVAVDVGDEFTPGVVDTASVPDPIDAGLEAVVVDLVVVVDVLRLRIVVGSTTVIG